MQLSKAKFKKVYREASPYCRSRGTFITSDFWRTLSFISVLYVAISVVLSPFILWGKLPVGILLHMNIIWGSLLIIIYGSFFITLLVCSLSKKRRVWFDRRIQYKEVEPRLSKFEKDIRGIKRQVNQLSKAVAQLSKEVKVISELISHHSDHSN